MLELEEILKKKPKALTDLKLEKVLSDSRSVSEDEAILLSEKLGVALHPKYLHYYKALNGKEMIMLHNFLLSAELKDEKIILTKDFEAKIFLERIGLPHKIENEKIVIDEFAKSIIATFSLDQKKKSKKEDPLEYLCEVSGIIIKDKAGSFIGARMGRPEQAKRREMKGNPHVLFPVALKGGSTKSINRAIDMNQNENGKVKVDIAEYFCGVCKKKTYLAVCGDCGKRTKLLRFCRNCEESFAAEKCPKCGKDTQAAGLHDVDLRTKLEEAKNNLRLPMPALIKGVKGMISDAKEVEPLEKGILRARHNVHIFRDGTSRYELLNATITHFKLREINMTIAKAKELGYETDYEGKEIVSEEQLIEIFPQDIIVNDDCGGWMLEVSRFVDEELERFYGKKPFYNAKTKEDLIGTLLLGLAPHTSAAVTSRVIGYTKARLGFGHPFWVCAKRRNVDGDQDSVLLLMDGLLNFSLKYLANRNGGKMDAPIVFSTVVNPREVDDEVYNMEICTEYPLSFYEKATKICDPFIDDIKIVNNVIDTDAQYTNIGFTHTTDTFDEGPKMSRYVQLKSMEEKINRQNELQKKIMAVDAKDCLERVMGSHFMPDIVGNARAFSRQTFRCTHCNEKYRRIPLSGKCYKCGKDTVILTIHQGSVRKYLKIAQNLAKQEHLSDYLIQRLEMIEKEIDSVFNNEKMEQKGLFDFV